jgi:transmembrane sensor
MSENERGRALKGVLDARVNEARIHRSWRGVETRLGQPRARPMRIAFGGVVLAAAAALLLFVSSSWMRPESTSLALEGGAAPTEVIATSTPRELVFEDASRIVLSAASELAPTRNDAAHFDLRLSRGSASFSVTPGGARAWSIDCGLATVQVVGTVFRITHQGDDALEVAVQRGHVRVVHEGGVRELHAGESFTARRAPSAVEAQPRIEAVAESPSVDEVLAIAPEADEVEEARERARPMRNLEVARPWLHLAQEGDYASSYATLGDDGTSAAAASASPSELLLLSDVARLSGHPSDAVAPLERLLREHARDPNAPLAAIMLGRVYQDVLHRPLDAVNALERARTLGPPSSLEADVESRFALALFDADDPRAARIAEQYLAAHPTGPRAAQLQARLVNQLDDVREAP